MATQAGGLTARRGRLKGVDVRPGSVRVARQEAGLSLAGVAGSELTRAAIHLVETGRSRPSMPTLELIARRTGKPLSFFVGEAALSSGPEPRLDELEFLVESMQYEAAVAMGGELLGQTSRPWSLAQIHFWLGQAHTRAMRPGPGLDHLRLARTTFEERGDRWMVVECMDWEAAAMSTEQDPAALGVAQAALEECRLLEPRPVATETRLLTRIANAHMLNHEWAKSIQAFEAALETSESLRDLGRMARAQQGLAIAYGNLGDTARSIGHAQRALQLHTLLRDRVSIANTENNLAHVLMKQGDLAAAERHLTNSLAHSVESGQERGRSHILLTLAELAIKRYNPDAAEADLERAVELATRHAEPLNLALAEMHRGHVAALRGDAVTTDRHFERALAQLQAAGSTERLIECHSAYAEVLEQRGDTRRALQHAKLALAASRPALAAPAQPAEATSQAG